MPDDKHGGKGPWFGRGLLIDLDRGGAERVNLPEDWGREFLGGAGLAARLLYKPGNKKDMVIAPGLFVGLPAFTACKVSICAISPLTGRWGESTMGGHWPLQIKRAGWDLIWIRGQSPAWTTIRIKDAHVEFEPADELLGLSTQATESALKDRWGRSFQVACIGPAAENKVRFASIRSDKRMAGRCGMGLDWAQRKIKAICVSGSGKIEALDPEALRASVRAVRNQVGERTKNLHEFGTAGATANREFTGDLPIRNFAQGLFEGRAKNISGQAMVSAYKGKPRACPQCPIACGKDIDVPALGYAGPMPEYETVASLGSLLLIDDPEAVIAANRACNELGLDTISTGVVAAYSLEAFERGYLSRKEFGDLEPRWGSKEFLLGIIDLISRRQGIGDLLADGVKRAAERLGTGAHEFAMHSHGLELPMHDPRALVSLAPTYALGTRGASHNESMSYYVEQGLDMTDLGYPDGRDPHTAEGKGRMVVVMQNISAVYDNLGVCKFMLVADIGPSILRKWLYHATGWDKSYDELMQSGARSVTLKHLFNIDRMGIKPEPDLPRRILCEPRGQGGSANVLPDLKTMVREFYKERGWSEHGYPPEHERPIETDEGQIDV
jgi:aldehyde:ferredoxin oxidoreductase